MIEATKADRDAAADYMANGGWGDGREHWLANVDDSHPLIQAFAHARKQAVQEAVAERDARIAELERERRNLVSHATGGQHTGEGMSLNDVCVAISAFRNVLYEDGKERGRAAALQENTNAQP